MEALIVLFCVWHAPCFFVAISLAIVLLKVGSVASYYKGVQCCVVEKRCDKADNRWHVFSEKLAWPIMDKSESEIRMLLGVFIVAYLHLLPWPRMLWLRLCRHESYD